MAYRHFLRACLVIALLCGFTGFARAVEPLFISEFLAANNGGLRDEDGDSSDWIEIFNSGTSNVNLNGWYLTDSAANLTRWRFPSTSVAPNGFAIVFASGKNRAAPGVPLHANFSLNSGGEYLALVHPDGVTIANAFSPAYPEQFPNVSYGVAQNLQVTTLLSNRASARVLVPANGTLGTTWTAPAFDDSTWIGGTNGVGYETFVPGFAVKNIRANVGVCDLSTADSVLSTPSLQAAVFTETRSSVNYLNTGSSGNFGGDVTFPGLSTGADIDNFALEATGILTIPTSGNWTFGVNSDDGFRVVIGANTFSYPSPRGPGDTFATFNLAAGEYPVRLVFYECGGGSEVEFFAAAGSYSSYNGSFRLVGDTASGGLAVKSLPTGSTGSLRPLIATDVQAQMANRASSAYIRLPFNVPNPAQFSTLTLRVKYDDGFVAYLNGTEVARRNVTGTALWNSVAASNRPSTNAIAYEDIDLTSRLNLLKTNANVLAIHGLNDATNSSDFLVTAELVENKVLGITNHYFATPSPAAVNGSGFFAFVENLKFAPGRGWFDSTNFSITITSATPGITIRYTTNGSIPSPASGLVYTGPIPIRSTLLVRAMGYRDGFEPTELETHSYIFLNQVQAQSTNVNWAGGSSANYTLDTNITQSALYGPTFKSDLLGVPTLSVVLDTNDLWGPNGVWSNPQATGVAWERPCSLEYMRPDGSKGFYINCGIRIQGGASRDLVPKHGLRVLFKSLFGPGHLDYPLYDSPVQQFDTLTLHATFNDHWLWGGAAAQMLRDQWCRDTQNAMGGFGPHGTYVHLYLNGLYWGLYNMGEKGDASYAASYLGGDKEEYDALNSDELVDGDTVAWNTLFSIASSGIGSDTAYTNISQYLDIPNFIDYMLMNFYGANTDWPWHNWNAARRRVAGATFHFFSWDAEWTFGIGNDVNTDRTGETAGSPGTLYTALRAHPEFRLQFADHAQRHLFNGGVLTPAAADARWMKRATEIDRAIVGESARWGGGNTRATWLNAQAAVRSWFPQRASILANQLRNAGLMPQLAAPTFAPYGGLVPPAFSLSVTNPNSSGAIYFTTDGSDPRLWGGALSPSARVYASGVTLTNAAFLRARVRSGTDWSPLVEAIFYVIQDFAALQVTELMYNPPASGTNSSDDLEFLELKNTGTNFIDLSGLQFTEGITFSFTNGTRLAPGAFFVLARNNAAFAQKYPGIPINGLYTGKLDNNGEKLTLSHVLGTNVFSFTYNNTVPWPVTPHGYGFSLVHADLQGDASSSKSWRPGSVLGGTPGADDAPANIPAVFINEILTHTDPPQQDQVELFNPTAAAVDVSGWFLSDDAQAPKKYRIPDNTHIPAGGYVVFTESQFNSQPGIPPSFALSSLGESLFLFSGDAATNLTGYSHSFDYGAAALGASFGRYVISTGDEDWPELVATTFGSGNATPRVGPVVINEISYHPLLGFDEFVELYNAGTASVPLYDPIYPTNAWKLSGLGYTFSNHVSIPAGGYLLVVPLDPAAFRAKYSVPAGVSIVGPFPGSLQDSGERLRLERPETPITDTNGGITIPYVLVDEVRYNDKVPWPLSADGDGPSLQRRAPGLYGNEPTNWFASGITPGLTNSLNLPPTVAITAPTNNASYVVPATITLAAVASDPDGSIARVEFYEGGVLLAAITNAPYNFIWSNVAAATHEVVAKAIDNRLSVTTSSQLTLIVLPPPIGSGIGLRGDYYDNADFTGTRLRRLDPVVNFDWGDGAPSPAMGVDTFSVRWTGQVQPRFAETYTFYTVTDDGVRLWINNQLIIDRWVDQAPTEWSGTIALQAGQLYDIRLEFYENGGGAAAQLGWSSPSVPREIIPSAQLYPPVTSNLPPAISLTSPATGSVYVAGSPISIASNPVDPDGAVAKVAFYANATKLTETAVTPYSFSWNSPPAGVFSLTGVVTDDSGTSRTSAPVNITVVAGFTSNLTLIATGSVWRYLDNGSDQGSAWQAIAFNDAGWSNGLAQLGYGDNDERTVVGYGPDAGAKYITTYFRRAFTLSDAASFTALNLRVLRDDGVVVYLNGSEVFRDNMPGGAISYSTPASTTVGGDDETISYYGRSIDPGYLVNGTNVIAVEIHQNSGGSSDISFDFELAAVQSYIAPYFTAQPPSRSVNAGDPVTFSPSVAGTSPLRYQWRLNGTNLPNATNGSLILLNVQAAQAGDYTLVATNLAGRATSDVAVLTVTVPDSDGDGLPDAWETSFGLNPSVNDAALDLDGDGMSNLQEYLAGTNPADPSSVLRLAQQGAAAQMRFIAQSNRSYTVQFTTNASAPWKPLTNIAPVSQVRTAIVIDPTPATNQARFYRAVTP